MPSVRQILADPKFQQMDLEERRKVLLQVDGERFGALERQEQDKVLGQGVGKRASAKPPADKTPTTEQRRLMEGLAGGADARIEARDDLASMMEPYFPGVTRTYDMIRNLMGGVEGDPRLAPLDKREPLARTSAVAFSEMAERALPQTEQMLDPMQLTHPEAQEAAAVARLARPVGLGLARVAESFTTPENAAILAASSGAGAIPQAGKALAAALGAGFDLTMVEQAITATPEIKKMAEAGDLEGAIAAATELLAAGGLGAAGGKAKVDGLRREPGMGARKLEPQVARQALEDATKRSPAELEARNREMLAEGRPAVADVQQAAHEDALRDGALDGQSRKELLRKAEELKGEMPRSAAILEGQAGAKRQPASRDTGAEASQRLDQLSDGELVEWEARLSRENQGGKKRQPEDLQALRQEITRRQQAGSAIEREISPNEKSKAARRPVEVPEEGPSLDEQRLVDSMERIAEAQGKKFEDLSPEEQDAVFERAKAGYSTPDPAVAERQQIAQRMESVARELGVKFEELSREDQDAVYRLARESKSTPPETKAANETKAAVDETKASREETVRPKTETNERASETVDQADETDGKLAQPREPKTAPVYGRQTEVKVPGERKKYLGAYALREAEDVYASHNAQTFEANPAYEFTNDRDYRQPQNAERVVKQTAEFDPGYLVNDNPTAENGPPIIDSRGNVLGGNSRTMTLERARQNPEAAEAYRKELRSQAKRLGLDPKAVDRMKNPVLVRELVDVPGGKAGAQVAITDLNKKGTAELRLAERAVSDSRRVSAKTLETLSGRIEELGADGTLAKALDGDARNIVDRLTEDGVLTVQERPRLLNAAGRLTAEGKQRVSQLMVGRFFEDAKHFEDAPAALKQKLERVVAPLASLEGKGDWDISTEVKGALSLLEEAQNRDLAIDELTAQRGMFGERNYSREAILLAKRFEGANPTELVRRFRQFAGEAELAENPSGLLGIEAPTRQDSFDAAFGGERKAETTDVPKPNLPIRESASRKFQRGSQKNIVRVDARRFQEQFEAASKESLAWNRERSEKLKDLESFDAYPLVEAHKSGRVLVNDGRHRIAEAARRGATIDVVVQGRQKLPASVLEFPDRKPSTAGGSGGKERGGVVTSAAPGSRESRRPQISGQANAYETATPEVRQKVDAMVRKTGALSLRRPEEVPIYYKPGKRMTLKDWEEGARVKFFPKRGDRPAVIALNEQASEVLYKFFRQRATGMLVYGQEAVNLREHLQWRVDLTRGMRQKALEGLLQAVKDSMADGEDRIVFVDGSRAYKAREIFRVLREELTHFEQFGLNRDVRRQADPLMLIGRPEWPKIDSYLEKRGYEHLGPVERMMEGAAQIAAGWWKDMDLDISQAAGFFTAYVEGARKYHGEKAERVARWATGEIRNGYKARRALLHGNSGGVDGTREGGPGGVRNSVRGSSRVPERGSLEEAANSTVRDGAPDGAARAADGRPRPGRTAVPKGIRESKADLRGRETGAAGVRTGVGRRVRQAVHSESADPGRRPAGPADGGRVRALRGDGEGGGERRPGRSEETAGRGRKAAREGDDLKRLPAGAAFQRKVMKSRLDRTPIEDAGNQVSVNRVADAAYQPKRGKRPGAVYVNQAGRILMDRMMDEAFGGKAESVGLTLTKGDVERVADALQGESYVMALAGDWTAVGRVRKVMTALERASAAEGTITVVSNEGPRLSDTKTTRRHESIHEALGQLDPSGERLLDWFESYDELLGRDSAKAAAERLRKIGYEDFEIGDELAVHIGAGQWERLGMDLDAAADYFSAYYDKLAAQYGSEATAHILERVDARVRNQYAENKRGGDNANQKPLAPGATERAGKSGAGKRTENERGTGREIRREPAGAAGGGGARERRTEGEAEGDFRAGEAEGSRTRRGVAEYLAKKRGEGGAAKEEARAKALPVEGGGGRSGDTGSPKTASPSPDPDAGRGQRPPETAPKTPPSEGRDYEVSPSYDQTRENFIARVGLDEKTKAAVREGLDAWEKQNPERRQVTFEEVAEEAKALDPALILQIDRKKAQDLLVTDPGMRAAAKGAQHAISREITSVNERLGRESVVGGERMRLERKKQQLEADFQKLTDVLIPTRSHIGRMLAYENMMASESFDVTYWLDRAKRAQALPEGVKLPEKDIERIREVTERGQAAEDAAVERVQGKKKTRAEAERQAREELGPEPGAGPETKKRSRKERAEQMSREEMVAKARQALLDRLDNALKDEKTAKVEPITEAERAAWENDPEVIVRRAKLANMRAEKRTRKAWNDTRESEVAKEKAKFVARLKANLKGRENRIDPVTPAERSLWEMDPEVLEIRAELARRTQTKALTLQDKQAHYKEKLLARIEQLTKGEKTERKKSKWELTPEQRREVERDPQVRAAARDLARVMREQRKDGWLEYLLALRSSGLLSAPATHLRNVTSNLAFQAFNEASRPAAMVADWALRHFLKRKAHGERTVAGVNAREIYRASREGATKGWQEAKEILKTGEVQNGDTALFDFTRELNAKHLFENRAGLKHLAWTNDAINLVFRTLKAEDRVFKRYAYERSLREQMELAKTKVPTEEMMIQAWADADFLTFNNENLAAKKLNQMLAGLEKSGDAGKAAAAVVKFFLPFRNTPANIWMRGFEAMGGGVATGAWKAMRAEGKLTAAQQRAIAMEMGRGATGMGLVALGFIGGMQGWIAGMLSDEERGKKPIAAAAGKQEGAIKVGERWISIAGLSPIANVVLVGATLAKRYADPTAFLSNLDEAMALFNATVKDQPMLRGLNDLIEAFQDKGNRRQSVVASAAGSLVPSALNATGQAIDSKQRDARGGNIAERAGKAIMARTPGLRQMLPERLDVLGRPVKQGKAVLTGFNATREDDSPAIREMERVGVSMAEGKPRKGESQKEYEERVAAARIRKEPVPERQADEGREEFAARQAAIGDSIIARVERLMGLPEYRKADDITKQHMIEEQIAKARRRAAQVVKLKAYQAVPTGEKRDWIRRRMGR